MALQPPPPAVTRSSSVVTIDRSKAFIFLTSSGVAIQVASGAYEPPVSKIHNIFGM